MSRLRCALFDFSQGYCKTNRISKCVLALQNLIVFLHFSCPAFEVKSTMSQLTKSWAHMILHMYIEANGFGSNDFRNDCITKLFYAMIPLNLLYPCLEICGLYISVSSSQFNPITVLLQFQYLLFFIGVNVIVIFDYTFFKQRLLACIMHVKRYTRKSGLRQWRGMPCDISTDLPPKLMGGDR